MIPRQPSVNPIIGLPAIPSSWTRQAHNQLRPMYSSPSVFPDVPLPESIPPYRFEPVNGYRGSPSPSEGDRLPPLRNRQLELLSTTPLDYYSFWTRRRLPFSI